MILAFPLLWMAGAAAAYWYSQDRGLPWALALAALPAFLLEISFYFVLGVERLRSKLDRLAPPTVAALIAISAVIPYGAASLALHSFRWESLAAIAGLAAVASFWYAVLPHKPMTDVLFLVFMAAIVLAKIFQRLYLDPHPRLPLYTLGQLMWIRTGVFALLDVRRMKGVGLGFWPQAREWKIGSGYFILLVPVAAAVAWLIGFAQPHLPNSSWEKTSVIAIATFFGILWVVALSEEFFFRGLLQQWIGAWFKSEWGGLAIASILFGCVHLWFRQFPNWRFAAMAAVAGVFYGLAFRQARSIRASMVTHALTVTVWRVFFS